MERLKKSVENYNSLANYFLHKQKKTRSILFIGLQQKNINKASFISLSAGFHIEGEKHHLFGEQKELRNNLKYS